MDQEIKPEQQTEPEQEEILENPISQTNLQGTREPGQKRTIRGIESKKSFLERSICIFAIISIIVCQEALECIFGSWWVALPVALAIHSIYIVFFFDRERGHFLVKGFLFLLSCCILYVGLVQAETTYANYKAQINLSMADERCCNELKKAVEERRLRQEAIVERYIETMQDKIVENLDADTTVEQQLQYISLLKKQVSMVTDEKTVQDTLDNIYQSMAGEKVFVRDEVFLNFNDFQKHVYQLMQLKNIEADISNLARNEEVKISVVINAEAWVERVGNIVICKKKLEMMDNDIAEVYDPKTTEDIDEAIKDMEQQLKTNVLDLKEFSQCIRLLFMPQSQYWDRLLVCVVAAFIINGLEIVSVINLVKVKN